MKFLNLTCLLVLLLPLVGVTQNTTPRNNTSTEQQDVFQEFWELYDRHYPLFPQKNIDWQNVYDTYFPRITATTTDVQLLDIFKEINATILKDGHTFITYDDDEENSAGFFIEDSEELRSMIFDNTPNKVNFVASSANNPYISYGTLVENSEIGFIHTKSFEPVVQDDAEFDRFKAIVDEALNALQSKKGIILDARDHAGGQPMFAYYLAGRFVATTAPIEVLRTRVKIDRGSTVAALSDWLTAPFDGYEEDRSDGGLVAEYDPREDIFIAAGHFQYTNKVALLTARGTGSAAEVFTGAMKTQPHVKSIGELTQGIFAGIEIITLNNGDGKWKTQMSVLDVETLYNGTYQAFEGIGIPPDELIRPTAAQVDDGLDVHIDAALAFFQTTSNDAESFADNNIELFPNPTTGILNIHYPDFKGNTYMIKLYNLSGQLRYERTFNSARANLVIDDLPNGYYLIQLTSGDKIFSDKLMIIE